jgi:hypothetical protein
MVPAWFSQWVNPESANRTIIILVVSSGEPFRTELPAFREIGSKGMGTNLNTARARANVGVDHEHGPEKATRHRRTRRGACEHEHCRDKGDADTSDHRRCHREPRPDRTDSVARIRLAWLWLAWLRLAWLRLARRSGQPLFSRALMIWTRDETVFRKE